MALMIALATFLGVGLVALMISLLLSTNSKQQMIANRLDAVRRAERRDGSRVILKLLRDEMMSSVPVLHRWMIQWNWTRRLQNFVSQAGMDLKLGKLLLVCAVAGAAVYVAASHFLGGWIALVSGPAAAVIPLLIVAGKRQRRLHKFEEHFPAALDLLGRAIRAGHAFSTGLEMIGKEIPEPVAGEFRKTFDEQSFGLPLRDALINLTERLPLIDVRFFVTALLVQRETGGNLAEILDGLSRVIRDRFRIHRDVRVKTAQGRLTAAILIALPPAMMLMLSIVNPDYIRILFRDPKGTTVLAIAAFNQLVGSALIWKIIHIEV